MSDEIAICRGSKFLFQRRLFTKLHLSSVLDQRFGLALEQFAEGSLKGDVVALVERIYERFTSDPISLGMRIELQRSWDISDGTKEHQFAVGFHGDPIFWECSPDRVHDVLPTGCEYSEWFLPPGETLDRPYGEVFRNQLILISSRMIGEEDLAPIRELLKQQQLIIEQSNKFMEDQLCRMACAPA